MMQARKLYFSGCSVLLILLGCESKQQAQIKNPPIATNTPVIQKEEPKPVQFKLYDSTKELSLVNKIKTFKNGQITKLDDANYYNLSNTLIS